MSDQARVLAFDLGASSGRAIAAEWSHGELAYREIHRFENTPVRRGNLLCWNFQKLLSEIRRGIKLAGPIDSLAFDAWGVDFGLIGRDGTLLSDPVHYRDGRTSAVYRDAFGTMAAEKLYRLTGNQLMPINTLFQLLAVKSGQPELLEKAEHLLFMPDLFAHALTGRTVCERTIASTSQLFDLKSQDWSRETISAFGLPSKLFLPTVKSGTVIGQTDLGSGHFAKVVAVAGHDTQCATAVISDADDTAFLSCGTWSLLGTRLKEPVLTEKSMALELSNELAADGGVDYLRNIVGLWLLQECQRVWNEEGLSLSFADIAALAEQADSTGVYIDPDDPVFSAPGDMPGRILKYCAGTGQRLPASVGETARVIYESLAMKYRFTLEQLCELTGKQISTLHILGGGSNAELLCRLTADICGLQVIAGPGEATALGNILIQFKALGCIPELSDGRKLIAQTHTLRTFTPSPDRGRWEQEYRTFNRTIAKNTNKEEQT